MEAFRFLSRGRRIGMAVGGIPIADMVAYAQAFGFLNVPRFIRLVAVCDEEYLVFAQEKAKSAA